MSHIAFDLDALPLVPKVARSAGIGEAVVGWGLTQMWEWCWREKTDKVTTNHLRGFFGSELGAILVDFGFLEAIGASLWRVKGAARYLRIQAAREAGGRSAAAAGNLKRGRAAPAGAGAGVSLQLTPSASPAPLQRSPSPTATSDERLATSDKLSSSPRKRVADNEKPVDPRHTPLREKLFEAFRRKRGGDMPWTGRQGKTLQRLLDQRAREDLLWPVALLAAFERALLATHPDLKSLEDFERDLVRYVGTGPPSKDAAAKPRDTPTQYAEGMVSF